MYFATANTPVKLCLIAKYESESSDLWFSSNFQSISIKRYSQTTSRKTEESVWEKKGWGQDIFYIGGEKERQKESNQKKCRMAKCQMIDVITHEIARKMRVLN